MIRHLPVDPDYDGGHISIGKLKAVPKQWNAQPLRVILQREKPTAVLLWTSASAFEAVGGVANQPDRPELVFMSSRLLGTKLTTLPEQARPFTLFTYPYREHQLEPKFSAYADTLLAGLTKRHPETRISTRTYAMIQVLRQALMDMDRHFYQDNLLDRIGMQRDQFLPDYLRLSFGPGQRYASKGCYIMQVGLSPAPKVAPGPAPQVKPVQVPVLLRKSEWVIH